jgi:hypothetical protein
MLIVNVKKFIKLDGFVRTLFIYHSKPCEKQDNPDGSEYQAHPFDPIRGSLGFVTQNSLLPTQRLS